MLFDTEMIFSAEINCEAKNSQREGNRTERKQHSWAIQFTGLVLQWEIEASEMLL